MDADRWRRISLLYHEACARAGEDRRAFLDSACGEDDSLRQELESLLTGDTPADTFLVVPAADAFADLIRSDAETASGVMGPGTVLGTYRIERLLGRGGMGAVFLAYDTTLRRHVALKVVDAPADGETSRTRLLREARSAAALNHPHICTVYEVGEANGAAFIAMEYVEGRSLRDRLDEGALSLEEAVRYGLQAADALGYAHDHGVVHRDFKAANVIVTETGRLKIVDFGLARRGDALMASATTMGSVVPAGAAAGTPYAMAPEQVRGDSSDARTDIWALGVLLYEMVTGARPFTGTTVPELFSAILRDPPTALPERVPLELRAVIERCLEKDPERRHPHARDVRAALEAVERGLRGEVVSLGARLAAWRRRPAAWIATGVVLVALTAGGWALIRQWFVSWAETQALPEITRLTEAGNIHEAYRLARQAERYLPADERLQQLLNRITLPVSVVTEPAGAQVFVKGYSTPDAAWELLGETPLKQAPIPYAPMRWRIVKEGFEAFEGAPFGLASLPALAALRLEPLGSRPPGMVRVPGGPLVRERLRLVQFDDYWLDRFEVTNREYKAFIHAGGYETRKYWAEPYVDETGKLSWDEAMARFHDATGRAGPATWQLGTYPEGHDEYPVSGISWYEAAAYCAYAGKRLPTVFHWLKALGHELSSDMLHLSNFGDGPRSVGNLAGLGAYGTYDMAGNVKEWAWNATDGLRRYTLGGAWGEPTYMAENLDARRPFDRAAAYGVRCARYEEPAPEVLADIPLHAPESVRLKPVGDEVFEAYRRMYAYDRHELNAAVDAVDDRSPHWRKEVVSFDAAYGGERMTALLFLPRDVAPPYQTVVWFPGGDAFFLRSRERLASEFLFDFIPRSGRALVYPIYKGMYERYEPFPRAPNELRDRMIQWSRDLGRTIDYLETRADIDHRKLAYYGFSSGAWFGPVFHTIESRFAASVLLGAGLCLLDSTQQVFFLPEMNAVNFAPRSTVPTLMINGRDDFIWSVHSSQQPLFDLLGAPGEHKRHAVLEGGHIPSDRLGMIREVLDWLDRFLGPVGPRSTG